MGGKLKLQQKNSCERQVLQEFRNLMPKRKVIWAKLQNLEPKGTLLIMKSKLCDDNLYDTLASFCPLAAKEKPPPNKSGRLLEQGNLARGPTRTNKIVKNIKQEHNVRNNGL